MLVRMAQNSQNWNKAHPNVARVHFSMDWKPYQHSYAGAAHPANIIGKHVYMGTLEMSVLNSSYVVSTFLWYSLVQVHSVLRSAYFR